MSEPSAGRDNVEIVEGSVRPHRYLLGFCIVFWICTIAYGTRKVLLYENNPGTPGTPAASWPSDSQYAHSTSKFTLVMLAHPDCPCTKASLEELDGLMAHTGGNLVAYVLFSKPGSDLATSKASDLWARAARIPGVSVHFDAAGGEAGRFGGSVSGQTLLYDSAGRLLFTGGITGARGHQGANAGVDAILTAAQGNAGALKRTAVFGCSLRDPKNEELKENPAWRKF